MKQLEHPCRFRVGRGSSGEGNIPLPGVYDRTLGMCRFSFKLGMDRFERGGERGMVHVRER